MAEVYNRNLAGKVVWLEMTRDEVAHAAARRPWAWSTSPRGFEPWPADRVRGEAVEQPSIADLDMSK
jgi:hypothetical protein